MPPESSRPATPDAAEPSPDGATYREVTRRTSWTDLRALLWFALLAALGLALASVARSATEGLDADLRRLLSGAPHTAVHIALVTLQGAALLAMVAFPVALTVARRWGLLLRAVSAAAAGALAFLAVSRLGFEHASGDALTPVAAGLGPGPSSVIVAGAAAVVATLRPVASRRWLTPLWSLLGVLAVLRTLASPEAPLDVVLAIGVGGVLGTAVLLAFGRSVHALTPAGVTSTLAAVGLPVTDVAAASAAGWAYRARRADEDGADGVVPTRPVLVRVVDHRQLRADNLDRTVRRLRLRDTQDDATHATPGRAVTAEAMVTLLAHDRGIAVPTVRAVARAPEGEALLAVDELPGSPLSALDDAARTPEVLRAAWQQVAALRAARIAHRHLVAEHVVVDGDSAALTSFAHGVAGASDAVLDSDVAELLASTHALVGAERAVGPALAVLGGAPLVAAAQRLVPVALTPTTRSALKAAGANLDDLLEEIARRTGSPRPAPLALERFRPRTLVMAAALAVAFYVLAPQLAEWQRMMDAVSHADWGWAPLLVLASVATYVGCGLGLAGGTPGRVPVGEAGLVALAGSFVATFSPPGVSTVGLNVRFLQRRGYPMPVAVSASAAKEAAVGVMHVLLLVVFVLWAGTSGALDDELHKLPPAHVLILAGLGVLAVVGGVIAVPRVRTLLRERVVPAVRDAAEAMRPVVASPTKLVQLFGGVVLVPLGYGIALWAAVRAFDDSMSLPAVVLVSLTAGALASAAPTPGGIGAVEAVLMAALTAIGMTATTALAAVMLYRLATFWIPITPGAVSFRVLTARKVL